MLENITITLTHCIYSMCVHVLFYNKCSSIPLAVLLVVSFGPQTTLSLQPDQEVSLSYSQDPLAPGLRVTMEKKHVKINGVLAKNNYNNRIFINSPVRAAASGSGTSLSGGATT